jgi:hypothetical protein
MANIQNNTTSIEKYSATSFIEQKTPLNEEMIRGSTFDTFAATALTTTDHMWGLEDFLSKPQILSGPSQWAATATPGTLLYGAYLPDAFSAVNQGIPAQIISFVTFYRAGFRIKLTVNATQFHAGKLMLVLHPAAPNAIISSTYLTGYTTLSYLSSLPHVTIDAEQSASAELDIPFSMLTSMYSRFDQQSSNKPFTLGFLGVYVMNQLRTFSTAPQSVNYTLFASMISPETHVPVQAGASSSNPVFSNDTVAQGKEVSSSSSRANTSGSTGALSDLMSAASSGAACFAQAETNPIGAISSGIDATEKAVSGLSNLFSGNFDYPNESTNPIPFIRMTAQNFALGGQAHNTSYELDLYPKQLHTTPFSYFGSTSDPMFVKNLVKIPTLVSVYSWSETQAASSQLMGFKVGPTSFSPTFGGNSCCPSWLSSISSHYRLWRGSIRLYFKVVATRFHSGRLIGIWVPHAGVNPSSTDLPSFTQSPFFTWDIQGSKEIVVDLPYNMNTPYLNVASLANVIGVDTALNQQTDCYSGTFYMYIQNELVGPADVNNVVDINVWACAGPDFELKIAKDPHSAFAYSRYTVSALNDTVPQGLDTDEGADSDQITAKELGDAAANVVVQHQDDQTPAPTDVMLLGTDYSHIKDLMRRYTRAFTHSYNITSSSPNVQRCFATLPVSPSLFPDLYEGSNGAGGAGFYATHLDHFSSHFAFWSGKLNYVICIQSTAPCVCYVTHYPDRYYDVGAGIFSRSDPNAEYYTFTNPNYATVMFNSTTQQAMPVTVPWTQHLPACLVDYDMTSNNYILPNPSVVPRSSFWNQTRGSYFNGTLCINIDTWTSQVITLDVFIAAGDDFQCMVPTAPPPLTPIATFTEYPAVVPDSILLSHITQNMRDLKLQRSVATISHVDRTTLRDRSREKSGTLPE